MRFEHAASALEIEMMMMPRVPQDRCAPQVQSLASRPERAWLLLRRGRDSVVAIWHGHLQLPAHLPGLPLVLCHLIWVSILSAEIPNACGTC